MERILKSVMIAALLTLGVGAAIAEEKPPVLVTAWVTTAGPYGEAWELTVTPEGRTSLNVSYMANPSGSLMAHFRLRDEAVDAIRTVVENEHFFDIPAKLAPKTSALHRPALQLDVRVGSRHHNVNLYDPALIGQDATVERFLKVWKALFAALPLKPSW